MRLVRLAAVQSHKAMEGRWLEFGMLFWEVTVEF